MSHSNTAITTERSSVYGVPRHALVFALDHGNGLPLLTIRREAISLHTLLLDHFVWVPLLLSMMFVAPLIVTACVFIWSDAPRATTMVSGFALSYALSVWYCLRGKSPLRDFRTRLEHVGTCELTLDFAQRLLVATETYAHAPQRNRRVTIALNRLHVCIDSVDATIDGEPGEPNEIRIKLSVSGPPISMPWARDKLDEPVFEHRFNPYDPADKARAEQLAAEVKTRLLERFSGAPAGRQSRAY